MSRRLTWDGAVALALLLAVAATFVIILLFTHHTAASAPVVHPAPWTAQTSASAPIIPHLVYSWGPFVEATP